jgi:NAD(P)-dependent dehydrogenase (short-subunit alcohol dehydrogenase family)
LDAVLFERAGRFRASSGIAAAEEDDGAALCQLPGDASVRLAYTASKAALNMLTVQYDLAFRQDPELQHIKINSVSPGWTATAMNGFRAPRTAQEGAQALVTLATLPDDGPSGGFFDEHGALAW